MTDVMAHTQPRMAFMQRFSRADLIFTAAIILLIVFAALASDSFLTQRNVVNISRQIVTNGFLSLGMLVVIRTGGIDLSVGSVLAFAGLLATGLQAEMHFSAAILVALAMGVAVGAVNGWLIANFNLQPFIVTLATMGSLRGLLYVYADTPRYPTDDAFRALIGGAFIGPIPVNFILFAIAVPIVWFYLEHTVSGRAAYALGVNKEAVRLAGVDIRKHLIFAYVICGLFAAIAGVLLASRLGIAQPSVGVGYELDAIAAVVIGGGLLGGGGGTAAGVVGGVLALAVVDNVLNLFNVDSYYQQLLKGLIILVAVLARRKKA
ncbi:ABC transporter permease [Rhizobium sp. BK251]|uniref:ABC transporter permease n=1 Tax=Rhizobium sp. BK251 TaxID=2512125 RepID=UPI0010ED2726|nr:ABC transporter permease [Rhizobium sp. BK251]TCL71419.1 ribose ABC transporter membrane protein [Rhizobium sp. BK251]